MLDLLTRAGFVHTGCLRAGAFEGEAPKGPGVYVFVVSGSVMYVGAAQRSLRRRLADYARPRGDRASRPVHVGLTATVVDVFTAIPSDSEWQGLPVNTIAGLEAGLIRSLNPPWNRR